MNLVLTETTAGFTLFGAGAVYNDATPDYNRKNGITTGSFEIPQDPNRNEGFRRDFVMYSRTTAFGPPIANRAPEEKIRQEYVSWSKLSGAIGGTPLANPIGMIGTATGINSRFLDSKRKTNSMYLDLHMV